MTAEYSPLPRLFLDAVDRFANPRAQMYRPAGGWEAFSAGEMLRRVAGLARELVALGIQSGDRVGIFAPNCPEWHVADFAIQGLGAVVVPVYFRESPERLTYILKDSGARIAFTAGEEQSHKIAECRPNLPALEHVIHVGSAMGSGTFDGVRGSAPSYSTLRYQDLIAIVGGPEVTEYRRRAGEVTSDQLATIIYTSGTTGEPKGVMLTHANLSSNSRDFTDDFELSPSDVALSLLPLAHVYERTIDYGNIFRGVSIAYVEQPETAAQALLEVRPTTMAAVPRFYEKTYANIIEKGHRESGLKRKIFDDAMRVA
ncbi:MAG TPA: AMP-binding protein, partial [Verrucomicrobiae bacterium]|nr:AMP-binding protein [Verrucomicrobiae bacterium]